jgi:hypothetical protein
MKYKDKATGVTYTRIKCSKCGKKSLVSFERQDICPSFGSTFELDVKRKEGNIKLSLLLSISSFGAIVGAIISTFWAINTNQLADLIWALPLWLIYRTQYYIYRYSYTIYLLFL